MIRVKLSRIAVWGILMFQFIHLAPINANESSESNDQSDKQNIEPSKKLDHMKYRGVVYDVGLQFTIGNYSIGSFDPELVKYDMSVIARELHANTVRIEGEEIPRLVIAAEAAHEAGLKVFFNPWKMHANPEETVQYMTEAALAAEKLRENGTELVFVTGCEYTIFNKGAFPGETFNERIAFMIEHVFSPHARNEKSPEMIEASKKLNKILSDITMGVRRHFKGLVTYASGTWEDVDWNLFDMVGIDYYRRDESEQAYVEGLDKFRISKPLVVMEVGSCTYEGAAEKGDGGFAILLGVNPDGTGIYEGGKIPVRSEKEQADYVETQVNLLSKAGVDGVFVYVFAFPIYPYGEAGKDLDMTSYSLVKSFPTDHPRSQQIPTWEPKQAFHRLAEVFGKMAEVENWQ